MTSYNAIALPTGEERPMKSYMRNSKARLIHLEMRPNNNLKQRRDFYQAIFGLVQTELFNGARQLLKFKFTINLFLPLPSSPD